MAGAASDAGVLQPLSAQLAVFLALLLSASGAHKLLRWAPSRGVVRRFAQVPAALAAPVLIAVVAAEFASGLLLIVPGTRDLGGLLAATLLACYLLLIGAAIVRNRRDVDCGCSFAAAGRPLGAFQVSRNAVLLAAAALVAWVSARGGSAAPEWSQGLGGAALLAVYGALDQVMSLQPLRGGEVP
jgi:hypothetical protein